MDIKKALVTNDGRVKLLQEIIKEASALPQDKELSKLVEFCGVLVKAFTSPPAPKKGGFMALQMQPPLDKTAPDTELKAAIAAVTKGTATEKQSITADNLQKNDNDKD